MALSIKIDTPTQSNDATVLRVTDSTGLYNVTTNPGGWLDEADSIPATQPKVSIIDGTTYHLTIDLTITTSNGTEVTYDTIELYDTFGSFSSVNDLVFDIDSSMLIKSAVALGTSESQLPDGWYDLTYKFVDDGATYTDSTYTISFFVDGVIREKIYDKVRDIPYFTSWKLFENNYKEWSDILNPMYLSGLHIGMLSEVSEARKTEVLASLSVLENLLNQY
jgi:hypothetical protein